MGDRAIAIVGGGLAGLRAATLLERAGIHWVLIEARDRPGGRLLTMADDAAPSASGRFDLGATWYWPQIQPELDRLVQELGVQTFEQPNQGDLLIERRGAPAPIRSRGWGSEPASMRLVGGMGALVDALASRLPSNRLLTDRRVTRIRQHAAGIDVDTVDTLRRAGTHTVSHVLLALPPRLAVATMDFEPALPDDLQRRWADTATWMAPHAKYLAVYAEPFWRADGLSGAARSDVGPMVEIHDASSPDGAAALFGFIGVPAEVRRRVPDDVLRSHCRAQLVRLFGERAGAPQAEWLKDWAADPYTATAMDERAASDHAPAPIATPLSGPWRERLVGIASEWSPRFPGYVAGAVDAAERGVAVLFGASVQETP